MRQARPRGAARHRRDLHGGVHGDDRPRRLAAQRLPHARAGAVLRRHLLPARRPRRHAELAPGARGRGRRLGSEPRPDPEPPGAADRTAAAGRRRSNAPARTRSTPPGSTRPSTRCASRSTRTTAASAGAEVPAGVGDRVPAAPRRGGHDVGHAAGDGGRRHVRPGRRRVRALLGRRPLAGPALREDALRQRAPGSRVPARLAGDRRRAVSRGVRADAGLGAARDARSGGRLLLGARRRFRGRRGKFYVWTVDELRGVLGADADAAIAYFGATAAGNFEGANILTRGEDPPERLGEMRHSSTSCARSASGRGWTTSG